MLQLTPQSRIFLATDPVDFRKGIDGLAAVCRQRLGDNPFEGAVYVFRNRSGTALKLLLYDGQGYWMTRKRHNTSMSESPARQVTIIDPTHPLYGRTLPLLRSPSTRSKTQLLVQLPDGLVQRLPREVTDLEASVSTPHPQALIAVPSLLPLVHLICAMLTGKEEHCDDTAQPLTPPAATRSSSGPPSGPDLVERPRRKRAATTGPLSLRSHPADGEDSIRQRQGE